MKQQVPWEQLVKYFAGELTKEEHWKIESWMNADPGREQQVRRLYEIWQESGHLPYQLDVDEAWNSLAENMDELEKEVQKTDQNDYGDRRATGNLSIPRDRENRARDQGNTPRRLMMAVAAAILLAVGLYTYYGSFSFKSSEDTKVGMRELVAKKGERATYVLNDSTRIMLHAGSRIEIPTNFNVNKRELFLEGEAYFEVSHDSSKPFIVHSSSAYTRVLGTKFLVQAWSGKNKNVEVVVSEGKVALGDNRSSAKSDRKKAIVRSNQKGILTGGQKLSVTDNVDLNWYLGWTEGQLVFDNRPLRDIIPRLERWYNVKIKTADKEIASKKLTAEIDYSQSIGEILRNIALTLDLRFEREGRTVTFGLNGKR